MTNLAWDFRHASRTLAKCPGLVLVSAVSLGLGAGVNLVLFMVLSSILLFKPTLTDLDRFVGVEPGNSNQLSYLNYRDLRDSGIFEEVIGFRHAQLNLRTNDNFERTNGLAVTANFFQAAGVNPRLGRVFTAEEAATEREPRVAVLRHGDWERRFHGDPNLIGQFISLNSAPFLVVGVLPKAYRAVTGLESPDLYVPLSTLVLPNLGTRQNGNSLTVMGKLKQDVSRGQVQSEVTAFGQELERIYPQPNAGFGRPAKVFPLRQMPLRGAPSELLAVPLILAVLFGLVLLIACANVAGLLLARAADRRREIALRTALGMSRRSLIQSLLAESVLLAFLRSAAGLLLAVWFTSVLSVVSIPGEAPIAVSIQPDLLTSVYGLALALITGVLCGVIPAFAATKTNIASEIRRGGAYGSPERLKIRQVFVVGQVAVSLTLIVVSVLFVRSMQRIVTLDPGFDLDHGLVAVLHLEPIQYSSETRLLFVQQVTRELEGLPGVQSASFASFVPLAGDGSASRFEVEGRNGRGARTLLNWIGPRYFETLGIPLLRGRDFGAGDRVGAPPVVIVNQTFANTYFPGENPLGKRVRDGAVYAEIVGMARDSSFGAFGEAARPFLYYPYAQQQHSGLAVHLRAAGSPGAAIPVVRRKVAEIDRTLAADVQTIRQATSYEFALRKLASLVLGSVGGLGLFLAMVGLYGVMAYVVASRTSEIGIRMALGASPRNLLWAVLGDGLSLVGIGIAIGGGLSLLLTRPLGAYLAGVSPADPAAFSATALILVFVGLCATYAPARRATRVDPMAALRQQ